MYTTCGYKQFIDALTLAERVVGKKESLPVLSCVLLETKRGILTIKATNLESGIEITVPAKTEKEGVVAVPVHILTQTLKSSSEETITLSNEGGTLVVTLKKGHHTLKTIPHDEFPLIPKASQKNGLTISKQKCIDGIASVSYAASTSTIRPEFASIFIHNSTDEMFTCVATDSFRLAEKKIQNQGFSENVEILLPVKNALELQFILEKTNIDTITITVDDGQCSVFSDSVYYVSRITDATFPNYTAIIPKIFSTEVTVLKQDIVSVLRKARIFGHTSQQVGFTISPKQKEIRITAQHPDIGSMEESLDAVLYGDDISINFNVAYIMDCFNSIPSDSVTLQFAGSAKPLIIRGVSEPTYQYLVMPLNR